MPRADPARLPQHLRDMGFTADARRRRHQCAERRASAGRAAAGRGGGAHRRHRIAGRRDQQTSDSSPSGCGQTSPSPSSKVIRPKPHGPTWPRPPWPSGAARSGSRPTSTGRCPRNGDCSPETARWSRRLQTATDREPKVAGKPQPTLLTDALSRGDFRTPLVVGDRLDTDIAGANAAGLPSLLVLSGVSTADETVRAAIRQNGPTTSPPTCARCTAAPTRSASGRTRPGASRSAIGSRDRPQRRQRAEGSADGGAGHRERGVEFQPRRAARSRSPPATTPPERRWSAGPC